MEPKCYSHSETCEVYHNVLEEYILPNRRPVGCIVKKKRKLILTGTDTSLKSKLSYTYQYGFCPVNPFALSIRVTQFLWTLLLYGILK